MKILNKVKLKKAEISRKSQIFLNKKHKGIYSIHFFSLFDFFLYVFKKN